MFQQVLNTSSVFSNHYMLSPAQKYYYAMTIYLIFKSKLVLESKISLISSIEQEMISGEQMCCFVLVTTSNDPEKTEKVSLLCKKSFRKSFLREFNPQHLRK